MWEKKIPWEEWEIVESYNRAKDKSGQIAILAQLNNCDKSYIRMILRNAGVELKRTQAKRTKEDISEAMRRTQKELEEIRAEYRQKVAPVQPNVPTWIIERRLNDIEEEIKYYSKIIENSLEAIAQREVIYKQLAEHLQKGASA